MTLSKRITIFALCVVLAATIAAAVLFSSVGNDKAYASDVFDYVGTVKTVNGSVEGSKRGLRLFGYDNGVTANFKNAQTDVFSAELQIGSHDGKKDLKKYSLVFTDVKSGKSFAVQVVSYSDYSDVGVIYQGNKGGIVYYERKNAAYGMTAGYNADGVYTKFTSEVCNLTFDPQSMQVKVKADDGNFRVVWDFTKQYNDGKLLVNDLSAFTEYTVSIVLDEILANSRGDLMVYSFGGYSLADETVEYRPTILLSKGLKPVVGKEFSLPTAKLTDVDGNDISDKVVASVYDADGNIVADKAKTFTPQSAGTLYVYYLYSDGQTTADLWYKTQAVNESDITAKFNYDGELPTKAGVGAKLTIPSGSVLTDVVESGKEECFVTVKKDGVAVDGYSNVAGGFVFEVTAKGNYEIVYGGKLSSLYKTETKTFTADEKMLAVNVDVEREFAVGTTYKLPVAEFCLGGNKVVSEAMVVYPSGKQADGTVTLDEVGKYIVKYTATIDGAEYRHEETFEVKKPYVDNFDSEAQFAQMRGNNEFKGVKLSLTNNQTVTYNKVVDLSEYTFDANVNKGKTLVELNFDPKTIGATDIDSFYVVFTDKYDPTNYVTIRCKYLSYSPLSTSIRARASNQASWVGYYYDFYSADRRVDAAAIHEEGGFVSAASFTHRLDEYDFGYGSLKLYFDYQTKRLYSQPLWTVGHNDGSHPEYNAKKVPWLVYDFGTSDSTLSAGNKPWNGFTTGEAYVSVYAKGVSSTADVFMLNIGGEDLSKPLFDDTKAPTITVDVDKNNIPSAKVGMSYKVFDFSATDADSAIVDKGVTVTNDATGKQVTLDENMCFTPIEGGYTFTYYAVDAFGYRAEETIKVKAIRNVDMPRVTVSDGLPKAAYYGQTIALADYQIVSQGAGQASVDVKVTCGDVEIPVTNGKFVCLGAVGVYNVTYTVTDYIGQTAQIKKKIAVSLSEELQFDEQVLSLPKAFINGDKVYFGQYSAVYYNDKLERISVPATIDVTDGSGTHTIANGQAYTPNAKDGVTTATVTLSFDIDGKTKKVTRKIPINAVTAGEDFIKGYFVYDNAVSSTSSNGLVFVGDSGQMSFSFARPIYADNMMLRFIADAEKFAATSFDITLTDRFDGKQRVTLSYTLAKGTWYCSVNGGKSTETSFDGDGYLQLNYDNKSRVFTDGNGQTLGSVSQIGGDKFDGFTSGYVYLDCDVVGVDGKTEVGLRTINNQTINSVKRDMQRPYIKADGKYQGRVAAGSTVTLISATAYDVLNAVGDIMVSVKLGSKTVLSERVLVPGETFTVTECGTYTITYKVTDSAKNTAPDKIEFAVYDPVKPTLKFDGDIAEEVKVGQKIQLPKYTIDDNNPDGVTVYRYIMAPDGTKAKIEDDSVTFTQKGTYVLTFLVTDEHNNATMYRFVVKVK